MSLPNDTTSSVPKPWRLWLMHSFSELMVAVNLEILGMLWSERRDSSRAIQGPSRRRRSQRRSTYSYYPTPRHLRHTASAPHQRKWRTLRWQPIARRNAGRGWIQMSGLGVFVSSFRYFTGGSVENQMVGAGGTAAELLDQTVDRDQDGHEWQMPGASQFRPEANPRGAAHLPCCRHCHTQTPPD